MLLKHPRNFLLALSAMIAATGTALAAPPAVVPVGNAGNKADTSGFGAVSYDYKIGKYEVTNEEYCAFLNAAAKDDKHSLYDDRMDGGPEDWGGISRSGSSGSYEYKVRTGMGSKPVGYVTFESCCRYANWLSNGQGKGDTESGPYKADGDRFKSPNHAELAKGKETKWVVASENEWYKAAYYDANKKGGAGYWQYPAKSDNAPQATLSSNAATDGGSYKDAASAYGTFDQGGNAWEYNDNQSDGKVGLRGGSFYLNDNESYMLSFTRYDVLSAKWPHYGFRIVSLGAGESPNK